MIQTEAARGTREGRGTREIARRRCHGSSSHTASVREGRGGDCRTGLIRGEVISTDGRYVRLEGRIDDVDWR